MKIHISISPSEKKRLVQYSCSVHSGSHWGGGDVEIPEEKILASIINNADAVLEVPVYYMGLLLDWIAEVTGTGDLLISEDISILSKLSEALNQYRLSLKRRFEREYAQAEDAHNKVATLTRNLTGTDTKPGDDAQE